MSTSLREPHSATTHSGTSLNTQQFAGQTYDFNSNLYNMRRRYYLPAIGRFISRDPIGLSGGINVYTYTGDDPVNLSDPTGLCTSAVYDGPSGAGEASQEGLGNIGGIGAYLGNYPGFSPGVSVGGVGPGGPEAGLGKRLLPDHGGAYPGGDVVLMYQGQNGGGIMPVQFPGYNYCGPGNNGGSATPGAVDYCCKLHDQCYSRFGLSAGNMSTPGSSASPAQQACDSQLCNCVGKARVSGPLDFLMRFGIRNYFRCR